MSPDHIGVEAYVRDAAYFDEHLDLLSRVRAMVPYLIARGVFSADGRTTEAIQCVVDESGTDTQEHEERKAKIKALVERVIPETSEDREAILQYCDDEPTDLAVAWGDAAYLLGLAVGQQLAADALAKGGARVTKKLRDRLQSGWRRGQSVGREKFQTDAGPVASLLDSSLTASDLMRVFDLKRGAFYKWLAVGRFDRFEIKPRIGKRLFSAKKVQAHLDGEGALKGGGR